VFRDDIVFFIFLYQRWIYKVDKKRVNEFGFTGEQLDKTPTQSIANGTEGGGTAAVEKSEVEKKDD
jgi:hypothetical protein